MCGQDVGRAESRLIRVSENPTLAQPNATPPGLT
jgi:hypothetical protein